MLRRFILVFSYIFIFNFSFAQTEYRLPKVLMLTSGADVGRGTVADGVVIALQAFNLQGSQLRLDNRKVLLEPEKLSEFNILIIPTIKGYHDLPVKNSLMYMSDMELLTIADWVAKGGTLLTDVNIGRNTPKGADRTLKTGFLDENTYPLSKALGVELKEINTVDYFVSNIKLENWNENILSKPSKETWRLIPYKTQKNIDVLANWENGQNTFPAIFTNRYKKGKVIILPDFRLLHPKNDGGFSTDKQIINFYKFVYETSLKKHKYKISISPWKNGHTAAYCQTFDDGGNREQYKRIFDFVEKNDLPTVFFVTPDIDINVVELMKKQKNISIEGHSYHHPDFRKLNYSQTQTEFLMNREFWKKDFKGFRFPYVSNSFWGLYLLDKYDFIYDTSIAANHFDYIRGSVVPYNIPIFNDDFFISLDLLEISQIYHSDWYFYQKTLEKAPYTEQEQQKDAKRFKNYLLRYFDEIVKPNRGVMVYLGHPMYSGINKTTLAPLQELIKYLKTENVWIASINNVAERWNKLSKTNISIVEKNNTLTINIDSRQNKIEGFSLVLDKKPRKIKLNTSYQIKKTDEKYYLIFDLDKTEKIVLWY